MDFSSLGALGTYLLQGFVLPGFCYLTIATVCFPDVAEHINRWFKGNEIGAAVGISGLGIVGGLLLTSICFAIEAALRGNHSFKRFYPDIKMERIGQVEAAGKGTFYLNMISGSAIMHFNIAVGTFLILLVYLVRPILVGEARIRWPIVAVIAITVAANVVVAHALYPRARDAIDGAVKAVQSSSKPNDCGGLSPP
jgi:hypothetical protein